MICCCSSNFHEVTLNCHCSNCCHIILLLQMSAFVLEDLVYHCFKEKYCNEKTTSDIRMYSLAFGAIVMGFCVWITSHLALSSGIWSFCSNKTRIKCCCPLYPLTLALLFFANKSLVCKSRSTIKWSSMRKIERQLESESKSRQRH